jgi:peptide/nickel transport system substrate-binding protein
MLRQRKLWSLVAALGMLVVLVLSGCGPSTSAPASSGPTKGGVLIDGLFEEPDTLMSGITNETYAVMVDDALWAPLWVGDDHGVPQPQLATNFPSVSNGGISADGKTITIHLKPNLKWSDGQPLTSADVAYTLQLYQDKAYGLKDSLDVGNIASVATPDPSTVAITLKSVEPPFLNVGMVDPGSFNPMPQHIYGSMSTADVAKVFTPMVTSGPFMFKSEGDHVKGDHITLFRNPNYFQASAGLPYLDEVIFKIIPNTNTVLTALQSGSIDTSWFLSVTNLDAYRAIQGYTQVQDTIPVTWELLGFNETNPILADPVVRQVIAGSIKFDDILAILKGTAARTCDDAVGTFGHDAQLTCYAPMDATTAGNNLTQDGWVMGSDGVRHKGGKALEVRYTTTANNARRSETQAIIKQDLAPLGIKIDIVNQEATQYFGTTLYNYSAYDIYEFASNAGYDPDDHTLFACNQFTNVPGGSNDSHYCNKQVDAQYQIELSNPDQNARKQAFTAIHQLIIQDLPVVWLYSYPDLAIHKNTVHNYKTAATGETWNIFEWWCSAGKC